MWWKKQKPSAIDVANSVEELSSKIHRSTREQLEKLLEELDAAKRTLNSDEKRVLDYFYNLRKHDYRPPLERPVIYFLESDGHYSSIDQLSPLNTDGILVGLEGKGYISASDNTFTLTPRGREYLLRRHPPLLLYWERVREMTPPTVSFVIVLIGFVASVSGIIQFVDWARHLHYVAR